MTEDQLAEQFATALEKSLFKALTGGTPPSEPTGLRVNNDGTFFSEPLNANSWCVYSKNFVCS